MKFSLPFTIDLVFSTLISFLLFFITANYFFVKPYSVVIAIFLSIMFAVLVFNHLRKKRVKVYGKKQDILLYENATLQFNLMTKLELISFFHNALQKIGCKSEKKHGGLYIKEQNTYLFFKFGFEIVNKADIVKIFNAKEKTAKAYLLAENFSEEIKAFAKRFDNLYLADARATINYLKDKNCLPENKYQLSQPKLNKISALKSLFQRKKAKSFLLLGLSFLFMSYIVAFKIYYIICASIFLTVSLICLLFGQSRQNVND